MFPLSLASIPAASLWSFGLCCLSNIRLPFSALAVACRDVDVRNVKALIMGPHETPYEFGFFEVWLPYGPSAIMYWANREVQFAIRFHKG